MKYFLSFEKSTKNCWINIITKKVFDLIFYVASLGLFICYDAANWKMFELCYQVIIVSWGSVAFDWELPERGHRNSPRRTRGWPQQRQARRLDKIFRRLVSILKSSPSYMT